jgi:RNA polymerase sigma-70 factor (ECF subfamily)
MQATESQNIFNIREGDIRLFEQVFQMYCKELVRYANTILKNADEAEDIVQQLFVNLWQKRESLQVNTSMRSYLYRAVHNCCLNRIKQLSVKQTYTTYMGYAGEQHSAPASAAIQQKEVEKAIGVAIEKLPEQCRKIFKLSRQHGMRYQQIADELNLSVKTVENQMGKALKHMREQLKDYLPGVILFFLYHN